MSPTATIPLRRALAVLAALLAAAAVATAADAQGTERASCSSFGPAWAHRYNRNAVTAGNPVRIVSACCKPTRKVGVSSCYVTVTLVGTRDRGCESVEIGPAGLPVSKGRHEDCLIT